VIYEYAGLFENFAGENTPQYQATLEWLGFAGVKSDEFGECDVFGPTPKSSPFGIACSPGRAP
jgi:hypothetical protein